MAHLFKNDINNNGARSKTGNQSSKKQDSMTKNTNFTVKNSGNDDIWASIPNNSRGASNCDDVWGEVADNSSVSDNAWGQDRLVHGKEHRNRKNRSKDNSFRVNVQSSNWDEVDEEFPALASRRSPANVWEQRMDRFEQIKAIEPTSRTEEERMIQKAIELSKLETRQQEQSRRQIEEEFRLQTQLLEANPDMFEEFRESREEFEASADRFVAESYGSQNGYAEHFPKDETPKHSIDQESGWGYPSEESTKKKDLKKYESAKEDCDSWSQRVSTAPKTSSYAGARPKISKVVDMFGGWGAVKPPKVHHDTVEDRPIGKSTNWKTVDVDYSSMPSNRKTAASKPSNQLSSPPPPEIKVDNTLSEWDTVETKIDKPSKYDTVESGTATQHSTWGTVENDTAIKHSTWGSVDNDTSTKQTNWGTVEDDTATKHSTWDTVKSDTATKHSTWGAVESDTATEYSNWGTIETVNTNSSNSSAVATSEKSSKVHSVSHQQERTIEITSKDDNWSGGSIVVENSSRNSDNVELNSEKNDYSSSQNKQKLVLNPVQTDAQLKANLKASLKSKSLRKNLQEKNSELDTQRSLEIDKQEYQANNSEKPQGISCEMSDDTKAKIDSLEGKCFDSFRSVENDYAILLQNIDNKEKCISAPIPNQIQKGAAVDLQGRYTPIFTEHLPGTNTTESTFGQDDYQIPQSNPSQDPHIPEPHSLNTNYQDLPTFPPFKGLENMPDNLDFSMSNNSGSNIEPPKASMPTPGLMNPAFIPQPMPMVINPLMNPSLMMGMNPMMMQQMMMFSNPFFMQQFQQMDMYYKSMGMSFGGGMPLYPQPMPVPGFANNPNMMESDRPAQGGMAPPSKISTSPPGIDASHLLIDNDPPLDQPENNFWFSDLLSPNPSTSLIPPPKPTPASAAETKISPSDFASLSIGAESSSANNPLPEVSNPVPGQYNSSDISQSHQAYDISASGHQGYDISASGHHGYDRSSSEQSGCSSSVSVEVPCATGWGDLDGGPKSNSATGWNDDVDGWGNENATTARSMRNPTRHAKSTCRQPSSRPNLGRPKT